MRRAGVLALTLAMLLTGCGGEAEETTPTPQAQGETPPRESQLSFPCTLPDTAIHKTLTVDGEPSLRVEASSEGYWPNQFAQTLTLEIYLGEVEESSQTLTGTTGMAGEEFQLYCSDVDFDGDLDLYVTYSQGVENTFFTFYLWDAGTERFVPDAYGLEELSNVKFNVDEQFVVASRKTEVSEEITYYRYKEGQLAMVRQLAYDLSADPKVMRVTEVTVGEEWEPLRIVTPGEFTDEDWDEFLAWMDLTYFGEE